VIAAGQYGRVDEILFFFYYEIKMTSLKGPHTSPEGVWGTLKTLVLPKKIIISQVELGERRRRM
jgi:hypothetical protein